MARSRRSYRVAAIKGWITRRLRELTEKRHRGEKARIKSESRRTPAQKAQRTRDAKRIERELRLARRRRTDAQRRARQRADARGAVRGSRARPTVASAGDSASVHPSAEGVTVLRSLAQLEEDYGDPEDYDYEEIDVETSPDYASAPKGGK